MEIFNTQEVIKDENKLILTFKEGATFDDGLLERTDLSFQQLTPDKHVYIECLGFIPIELLAYLLEVSTHCSMTITIHDDLEASVFLAQIKNAMNLNVNIIVNND